MTPPTLKPVPLPLMSEGDDRREKYVGDGIREDGDYLVKIQGIWYAGGFDRVHMGFSSWWVFIGWEGRTYELAMIDGPVYEIIEGEQ